MGGDENIVAVIFDFRPLSAAEDVFDHEFVNAVRFQRVFEQLDVVDADKVQPIFPAGLCRYDFGQFFTLSQIIVLLEAVGRIKGLVDGGFGCVAGVAARGFLFDIGCQMFDVGG